MRERGVCVCLLGTLNPASSDRFGLSMGREGKINTIRQDTTRQDKTRQHKTRRGLRVRVGG